MLRCSLCGICHSNIAEHHEHGGLLNSDRRGHEMQYPRRLEYNDWVQVYLNQFEHCWVHWCHWSSQSIMFKSYIRTFEDCWSNNIVVSRFSRYGVLIWRKCCLVEEGNTKTLRRLTLGWRKWTNIEDLYLKRNPFFILG